MDKIISKYENEQKTHRIRSEIDVHPYCIGHNTGGVELIVEQSDSFKKKRGFFVVPLTLEAAKELRLQLSVALIDVP